MSGRRGHGEGSIYRRASDGRWVGVLDLGWSGGKRRRRTVYGKTRGAVAAALTALQRSQEHGVDLLQKRRTVSDWLDEWMRDVKALDGTRGTTIDRYRIAIDKHLKPGLGRIWLDKLSPQVVQAFVGELANRMAPASVVKVHAVLRSSLSDAERMSLVPRNVAKSVRVPSIPRTHRRSLTMTEGRTLLAAVSGERIEGILVLGLAMGMRRSEILGLRWEDVSFEQRSLTVHQSLVRSGGQLRLSPPKTRLSHRPLPVPAVAVRALEAQRARQAKDRIRMGADWQDYGLVFTTALGTPLEPRNVNRRFDELREEAGLPWLRLHDLRHGCATFLLGSGLEPRTVMEILGHSTIRLTMDLYGHVLPERLRVAADAMDQALEG
ncbi:MAG: site-specific integrase [Propionibacteriales bacterium]|nr:site-specific integrase [Propionibacteriales bacterium]HEV8176862.1 site-specific integrase [Gemmatimonadales bacterium]